MGRIRLRTGENDLTCEVPRGNVPRKLNQTKVITAVTPTLYWCFDPSGNVPETLKQVQHSHIPNPLGWEWEGTRLGTVQK